MKVVISLHGCYPIPKEKENLDNRRRQFLIFKGLFMALSSI